MLSKLINLFVPKTKRMDLFDQHMTDMIRQGLINAHAYMVARDDLIHDLRLSEQDVIHLSVAHLVLIQEKAEK